MINSIVQDIILRREIENPNIFRDVDGPGEGNCAIVDKTDRPKEGGRYAYFIGYKYPYKGIPEQKIVEDMHTFKRILWYAMRRLTLPVCAIFAVLMAIPIIRGILLLWIANYLSELQYFLLKFHYLKDEKYCPCAREIKRVFDVIVSRKKGYVRKLIELVANYIVILIEYDSAYRFRFQDVICEAKVAELKKGSRKEVMRLCNLGMSREVERSMGVGMMRYKWSRMGKYANIILLISREVRKVLSEFAKEADFKKLCPDEADRYFFKLRMDYNFEGKPLFQRVEERKLIEGDNWKYFKSIAEAFLKGQIVHEKAMQKRGV